MPDPASSLSRSSATKQQLQTSSSFTKQQTTASPSGRHLHQPSPQAKTPLGLTTGLRGHIDTLSRLTKDCINRDIDHPASATNASTSSTVSSYVYNLTIQLHLQSAPKPETILKTILILLSSCRQKLIDSCQRLSTSSTFNT